MFCFLFLHSYPILVQLPFLITKRQKFMHKLGYLRNHFFVYFIWKIPRYYYVSRTLIKNHYADWSSNKKQPVWSFRPFLNEFLLQYLISIFMKQTKECSRTCQHFLRFLLISPSLLNYLFWLIVMTLKIMMDISFEIQLTYVHTKYIQGTFIQTRKSLSVGSVHGATIPTYTLFWIKSVFRPKKCIYMPVPA